MTSPEATLKTVRRRLCGASGSEEKGWDDWGLVVAGGGGGGTENRARSWDSVSRMRDVISWLERRALVNILGGGNLAGLALRQSVPKGVRLGLKGKWT